MLSFSNLKKKKSLQSNICKHVKWLAYMSAKAKIIAKKETTGVKQSNLVWKRIYTIFIRAADRLPSATATTLTDKEHDINFIEHNIEGTLLANLL